MRYKPSSLTFSFPFTASTDGVERDFTISAFVSATDGSIQYRDISAGTDAEYGTDVQRFCDDAQWDESDLDLVVTDEAGRIWEEQIERLSD